MVYDSDLSDVAVEGREIPDDRDLRANDGHIVTIYECGIRAELFKENKNKI